MRLIPENALAVVTIWQESRGETFEGKVAVAEVIRNRMAKRYSSDGTVAGTIFKPWQFSGNNTSDPNRIPSYKVDDQDPKVMECIQAWETAKAGSDLTKGAVLYLNEALVLKMSGKLPIWVAKSKEVARVGRHTFYLPA